MKRYAEIIALAALLEVLLFFQVPWNRLLAVNLYLLCLIAVVSLLRDMLLLLIGILSRSRNELLPALMRDTLRDGVILAISACLFFVFEGKPVWRIFR
jgi:hypothetical protein